MKPDLPDEFEWPARTRAWWEVWRSASHSDSFTATDWDFLLDTALIHADFWSGNTAVAGELRARLSKMGATADDRKRLGISEPSERKGTPLDQLAERRRARGAETKGSPSAEGSA